jgi:hypothetical protein
MDFHEIWYLSIFHNSVEKVQVPLIWDKNNWYFTWRPIYIFDRVSNHSSQNEKILDKLCREIKTHTLCTIMFFENSALRDEIRWKKYWWAGRKIDENMAYAYSILKATKTQSERVILIVSPLPQRLHGCAYLIFCAYIVCPVIIHSMTFLYSRLFLRRLLKKA